MTSIAVVIAVSSYSTLGRLDGCARDGEAMKEILQESGKYSEILYSHDRVDGQIKDDLSSFVDRWRGRVIDELLFYFSGHGQQDDGEFFYLLSDFEDRNRRKTTLENGYIDNLARMLSPKVFVKIVDACNSGVSYVKADSESEDVEKFLMKNDRGLGRDAGF